MMSACPDLPHSNVMSHASKQAASAGAIIRPQPVTEKSLMESVAGFIQEVQSYQSAGHASATSGGSGQPLSSLRSGFNDPKLVVTWARFEKADINDLRLLPDGAEINGTSSKTIISGLLRRLIAFFSFLQGTRLRCS